MRKMLFIVVGLVLAACQSQPQTVPTLIDLDAIATRDAAAVTATAPSPAATPTDVINRLPTLPPTWTPSPPPPTPTQEQFGVPAQAAAATPVPPAAQGQIFFVFNGDSIARLAGDGSSEELILVGGAPADLALSPDGSLLAYTAQGSGSAREVFVISPDGSYVQQVSCLGFARVLKPAWSFDGQTLAFAGSQTGDGPLGIYTATFAGSGQCPTGNNQRQIAQLELNQMDAITWHPQGQYVFFASGAIGAVSIIDGSVTPEMILPSGFGPNLSPRHHPTRNVLTFLRVEQDSRTGQTGGTVYEASTAQIAPDLPIVRQAQVFGQSLRWSRDGRYLLVSSERGVWLQDDQTGSSLQLTREGNFFPQAVPSPDATFIAFVDGGRDQVTVPQVFVVSRQGGDPVQITFHQEGSITDLVWG